MRRVLSLLAVIASIAALLLAGAGPASAHSALRSTDPRDGTVLKTAPRQVTLTFTESVGLSEDSLRVLDPGNRRINETNAAHVKGRSETARVQLRDGLPDGTYTVAWRVVSSDSHPISGAFTFSIGAPSETAAEVGPQEDPASSALYDAGRYIAYGGLALLIGATTFVLVCWPTGLTVRPLRRLLQIGWWTLLGSTVALLPLRGPYESGGSPSGILDLSLLGRTLESRPGLALVARLVLMAGVAVFLVRLVARSRAEEKPKRAEQVVGVLLALALAVTWAVAEHASAGTQVPLAMTSSVLHLLAMGVWLGGLVALLTALQAGRDTELPAAAVTRFSQLAFTSVAVLVVTGVYQSWRGLGSWEALTSTEYGELLMVKTGAVVALVAAAAFSRRWTGKLLRAPGGAGAAAKPETERGTDSATTSAGTSATTSATTSEAEPVREVEPASERESEAVAEKVTVRVGAVAAEAGRAVTETASAPGAGDRSSGLDDSSGAGGGDGDGDSDGDDDSSTDRNGPSDRNGSSHSGDSADTVAAPAQSARQSAPQLVVRGRLRLSVLVEVMVGVLVLVLTTALTGTQPGRAELETAAAMAEAGVGQRTASTTMIPFDVGTPNGRGKVQVLMEPGKVGENTVECVIFGPDGGIATVPEIRLSFTLAKQKIGPLDARLTNRGGYWATESVNLPIAGTWTMKATIRTTDIDQVTVSRIVKIY
ncbi:copper resistance CopC/CopD family protein [Streptomyces cavernae]|uniref:copper resistance CopC/CopD family protein n=1 Tax=Streptomyces cavernae TaxID=2259034 RepID=UPI000FEBB03D|nr:copper resistance protein CopC [Streptomyces cavernae]